MKWHLDKKLPICPQMEEHISVAIATGELAPGSRLQSVRDMAVDAAINPNTVQKAMEGLEARGLIYSVRGSGWYVSDTVEPAKQLVSRLIAEKTSDYIAAMRALGCSREEIINFVKEHKE